MSRNADRRLAAAIVAPVIAITALLGACGPQAQPQPAAAAAPAPPTDAASIARGQRIATDWCARCHIVAAGQTRVANPAAGAPRFVDVAHRWAAQPAELRRFMDDLHLPMPTFRLWPPERDDVVAYLVSLDPAAGTAR
jgi:mono/diheme cytochrome c family protein